MSRPCKGNLDQLLKLMQGSLRPAAADRLRQHLKGCPGCASAHRRIEAAHRFAREVGADGPPEISWRQVEARLHWRLAQEGQNLRHPAPLRRAFALSAAAAVGAVAALAVLYLVPDEGRSQAPRVTVMPAPAPAVRHSCPAPIKQEVRLNALATLVQGEVYLLSEGGRQSPLDLTRPLQQGDRALTFDGRLGLQWQSGTGLRMEQDSELDLRHLTVENQELVLWQGKIFLQVGKRASGQRFTVLSQGVKVSVRGTHLAVAQQRDQVVVEVYEGSVLVESEDNNWKPVTLPAGFSLIAPLESGKRPKLGRLPDSPGLAESLALLNLIPWSSLETVKGETGALQVQTRPEGATLHLDHVAVGTTNITLRSSFQKHLLEVFRDGKLVESRWVQFTPSLEPLLVMGEVTDRGPRVRPPIENASQIAEISMAMRPAVQHRRAWRIRECYNRRLKQKPTLKGKLEVMVDVDRAGMVSDVLFGKGSLRDPYIDRCVRSQALKWSFAPSGDGKGYRVSFPFNLTHN